MKKSGLIGIYAFLFLLFAISVCAESPFAQLGDTNLLSISYPKISYYPINNNLTLDFHVYNSSGFQIDDASCMIHIYNETGEHIVEEIMPTDGYEYYYILDSVFVDSPGILSYLVDCNSTNEAGFISTYFYVNYDGIEPPQDYSPLAIIILIPLLFGIVCVLSVFSFSEDNWQFKTALMLSGLMSFVIALLMAIQIIGRYYFDAALQSSLSVISYTFGILIFAIMALLGIIYVMELMKLKKENRKKRWLGGDNKAWAN